MTTPIETKINNLILSLEAHNIHLGSVDTRFVIEAEIIELQREHIEFLSKRVTLLEERLELMEKTTLEHGEHIKKLADMLRSLAAHNVGVQFALKDIRNEQK